MPFSKENYKPSRVAITVVGRLVISREGTHPACEGNDLLAAASDRVR